MDKKNFGALTFFAGLTVGVATTLLSRRNREVVKGKAIAIKDNTVELSGKVRDKVVTIGQSVESLSKDLPKFQRENQQEDIVLQEIAPTEAAASESVESVELDAIPEQLEIVPELEKEGSEGNVEEEVEELLDDNSDILVK